MPKIRRGLPAELLVEIHKWLPMDFGMDILVAVSSALIARHNGPIVKRQINKWKEAMKSNKMILQYCTNRVLHQIDIDENGCTIAARIRGRLDFCAEMPIRLFKSVLMVKKSYIAGYYEVEILRRRGRLKIGLCDYRQAPKHGFMFEGYYVDSIECIQQEYPIAINKEIMNLKNAKRSFDAGDVVGIGLIHSPANSSLKYFVIFNGELFGNVELPANYLDLEFYPAAILYFGTATIRVNFGKEGWHFNPFKIHQFMEI